MAYALYGFIALTFLYGILRTSAAVAISAILCLFGWEQLAQSQSAFFLNYSYVTNLVVGTLVVLGLLSLWWRRLDKKWNYPTIGWWVIGLFVYAFFSTFWSPGMDKSLENWLHNIPYILTFVLIAPLLIRGVDDVQAVMRYFTFAGVIISFLLFFMGTWDGRLLLLLNRGSYTLNTYGNPLETAYMAGNIIFSTLLLSFNRKNILKELLRWLFILMALLLIIRTGSRGQLISVLLIMPFLYVLNKKRLSFSAVFSVIFFAALVALITNFAFDYLWSGKSAISSDGISRFSQDKMMHDMFGRFRGLGALFENWLSSPISMLFGLGNSAAFDPRILGFYPHFVPGEILCEEGLLGFLLFILIVIGSFKNAYAAYLKVNKDEKKRSALLFFSACFIYALFLSFKQGNLLGSTDLFMFSIILSRISVGLKESNIN